MQTVIMERFMIRANNDFTVNKYLGATLDFNFKRTKIISLITLPSLICA